MTPASLQQAVARYLDPARARDAQHRAARPHRPGRARFGAGGRVVSASDVDRARLPEPGAVARRSRFPRSRSRRCRTACACGPCATPQVPVVAFMLLVRRGAADDPPGKDGLAAITADMLDEGSGDRSAIEMHEALARLGAQFDTDIGVRRGGASSVTVAQPLRRPRRSALLADIVARPALREDDFARVRQLRLHRLTQLRDMPGAVADRAFLKLLYGAHPYGHSPIGSEPSLAAMTVDDVRAFHAAAIRPSRRDADRGRRLRSRRRSRGWRPRRSTDWSRRRRRRAAGDRRRCRSRRG